MSDPWFAHAPPEAQVARDMALVGLQKSPQHPGYRWATERGSSIVLPAGPELIPGVRYADLVAAKGDILGVRPDFELPEFIEVPGRAYRLNPTPITQAQWASVTGQNPSEFAGRPRNPVEQVVYREVVFFCRQLEVVAGLVPESVRPPSAEEWLFAARAGEEWSYAGGNEPEEVAWYERNSEDRTHSVAKKKPNAWGFYDMTGNVEEWTVDTEQGFRITCGGNFGNFPRHLAFPARNWRLGTERTGYVGCRLVWVP